MYAMSDEESWVGVDLGVARVPAWSGIQGRSPEGGLPQGGGVNKVAWDSPRNAA